MYYARLIIASFILFYFAAACQQDKKEADNEVKEQKPTLYLGADLSYVNEVLDCDGVYRANGNEVEPYEFFAEKGANLVRLRLWHNPDWTDYSNYPDVEKAIQKSKAAGMNILLDFHYSDTWADPGKQIIPAAWKDVEDQEILGDSVYQYTYQTLQKLHSKNLTPEMVQVGNETNSEILKPDHLQEGDTINWERNLFLLNKGLQAVHDFNSETGMEVEAFIHIAQPENALWWFKDAKEHGGLMDFDYIGLSYYPKWSSFSIDELSIAIDSLTDLYDRKLMVVETSYPYTLQEADSAGNILDEGALIEGYPATPEGQLAFMKDLTKQVVKGGGEGVIYWEPAWITNSCNTLWGKGSHWDNATFFDAHNGNEALPAFDFYNQENYQ